MRNVEENLLHVGIHEVHLTIENYQSFINENKRLQGALEVSDNLMNSSLQALRGAKCANVSESRIGLFNQAIDKAGLTDLQEAIIDCRICGMEMTDIALQFRKSRQTVYIQFERAIEKIAAVMKLGVPN